jgi:hypothetical protein
MSDINRGRTIFIKEDTPLPATLSIETEAFLPGWWVVKNLDSQALTREVEGASWNFFYLAGEIRATAFGGNGLGALRRAVERVLAKQEGRTFNSLELTKIVSKRFLGIPFMSVTAHARHIQKDIGLIPAKNFVETNSIKTAPRASLYGREQKRHAEMTVEQYSALIFGS